MVRTRESGESKGKGSLLTMSLSQGCASSGNTRSVSRPRPNAADVSRRETIRLADETTGAGVEQPVWASTRSDEASIAEIRSASLAASQDVAARSRSEPSSALPLARTTQLRQQQHTPGRPGALDTRRSCLDALSDACHPLTPTSPGARPLPGRTTPLAPPSFFFPELSLSARSPIR